MTPLLDADSVTVSFGGLHANVGVDLAIEKGEFVGLIGANGAGKTTFVDAVTGFAPVTSGAVRFDGEDITRMSPDARASRGLVRTFQSLELFEDLTVRDNLLAACERSEWWQLPRDLFRRTSAAAVDEQVAWALRSTGVENLATRLPQDLSHGQRKLVGVARALACRPKLLLLDEPAAGLDAHESAELSDVLRGLLKHDITVFLIDHDMGLVLSVCDRVYVMDFGKIVSQGTPAQVRRDPAVIAAYLGDSAGESAEATR